MDFDQALSALRRHEAQFLLLAQRQDTSESIRKKYEALHKSCQEVLAFLEQQRSIFTTLDPSLGDLSDLPEELLSELTVSQPDEQERQILSTVTSFGGAADLDQILVGLFRKFGVVLKRRYLQNKVWRMTKKNSLFAIPGRRGLYSLTKPEETEAELQVRLASADEEYEKLI